MASHSLDVLAIGNAIVDVLANTDDAFLDENKIEKGAMTLIDQDGADALYDRMPPAMEKSGGSAANTAVGIASFGGRAGYIGKIRNDQLGSVFAHDIKAADVQFQTPASTDGPSTARCLILVTPDAERSMCTYLGACVELTPDDVDEDLVAAAKITYLEGYLYDPPEAKRAFEKAAKIAAQAGNKVSLTLSDAFCVDRYREEFQQLVERHVDVLFANESEIKSLYQTETFDEAMQIVRQKCELAALTRSESGSVIVAGPEVHVVDARPVDQLTDTTGAGDLYAAGFLYGLANGCDLLTCGRLGSLGAAEIISHYGARPETSLQTLAREAGLIA